MGALKRDIAPLLCLMVGITCIPNAVPRVIGDPYGGWDSQGSGLLSADIGVGIEQSGNIASSLFSDNLYAQLMKSSAFRMIFDGRITDDIATNIGTMLGQAFAQEFNLNTNEITDSFVNSLAYVYAGAGAETYASAIANISTQILGNYNILDGISFNAYSLANTITNIVIGCVTNAVGMEGNMENMFDIFDVGDEDVGANVDLGLGLRNTLNSGLGVGLSGGTGLNTGLVLGGNSNLGLGAGLGGGLNAGLELGANSNLGLGAGLGSGLNAGLGLGANSNLGLGAGLGGGLNAGLGLGANSNLGLGAGLGGGLNAGLGLGANSNLGLGAGLGGGLNAGLRLGANSNLGLGAGLGGGLNAGLGLGANSNLGLGAGLGFNAGLGLGANSNLRLGSGLGVNAGLGLGAGVNSGLGLGAGLALGSRLNAGLGLGAGLGVGAGLGAGAGLGVGAGLGAGAGLGLGANANANLGLGVGLNTGLVAGVKLGVGVAANDSLSVEDAMVIFKQRLMLELLRDKTFRAVFSDSIPTGAISSLASAITQFLSKAFSVPRSFLLTLENDLTMLVKNDIASPEAYAEGISISLTNLLAAANLIAPSAVGVQLAIAAKAITSGIQNFLGSSKVEGVGLGIGSNSYNSYFSVLSGLEMLPYVGPDAISRKYPPILKAAKASKLGAKFSKVLYSNLISSSKFAETFVLGTPAPAWKRIAKILGTNMAEAFGSPNPSFFVDTYANALMSVGYKLSYKTYARVIAAATSKALYALGYFVSGNSNIQAAIASNAIIKALNERSPKSNREFPQISSNLGLSWMTQIAGVPPPIPQTSTKDNGGINVDANVNAGLGVDVGLGVGADLGLDVNAGLGVGADLGLDVNAGLGLDANVNANADVGLGLGGGYNDNQNNGFMKRRRRRDLFDSNTEFGVDADVNANVGVNVDVAAGVDANVGLDLGADVGLGLGSNLGLGLGVGANVGLGNKGSQSSNLQSRNDNFLSILDILPRLLSEKLFSSTAMFTAMNIVGSRKVENLIAQAFAAQFGLEAAAAFANTYDANLANTADGNIAVCMAAIASATTNALGTAGILNNNFTLLTVDQLATAIVAKFSSLIATSLDSKDWNIGTKWSYIFDQDFIDPPMSRGYSYMRPNVFSGFAKSLDDVVSFDYNLRNTNSANSRIML